MTCVNKTSRNVPIPEHLNSDTLESTEVVKIWFVPEFLRLELNLNGSKRGRNYLKKK